MATRTVSVKLQAEIAGYMSSLRVASRETQKFGKDVATATGQRRADFDMMGKGLLAVGAAAVAGLGMATKAAIDWDSAFAGVEKTVDGTAGQMAILEGELRELARTGSASHQEVAAVAEAAGQLGVAREDIASFTKTMIDLGETTNLTADQAATSLARFSNIMGTSHDDVERLGSVLVGLGNNSATTEAEILELGTRLAAAGKIAGLSESDVFAFASTLTSVGVEAEAGGTALSKVFTAVRDATLDGGDALETFAEVAGTTTQEFTRSFEEDPARAVSSFIEGLGRMNAAGESTSSVFSDLGLQDQRLMRALLSTAEAGDLLTEQLGLANEEWEAGTALSEEAAKRYDTAAAKIEKAWNGIKDAAISVGESMLPLVEALAGSVSFLADMFGALPGPVKGALGVLGGVAGVAALAGGSFLLLAPRIAATKAAMQTLGGASSLSNGKLRHFGGTVGKLGAAFVGLHIAGSLVSSMLGEDLNPQIGALGVGLEKWAKQGKLSGEMARIFGEDASQLSESLKDVADSGFSSWLAESIEQIPLLGTALAATDDSLTSSRERIAALDQSLAALVNEGNADAAAAAFQLIASAAEDQGIDIKRLEEILPGYIGALEVLDSKSSGAAFSVDKISPALRRINPAVDDAGTSLHSFGDLLNGPVLEGMAAVEKKSGEVGLSMEDLAGHFGIVIGTSEEAAKETEEALTEMLDAWSESFAGFVPMLGAYETKLAEKEEAERASAEKTAEATKDQEDSWEDYVGNVAVTVDEYLDQLKRMSKDQKAWSQNMINLSGRIPGEMLDHLARLGPEGAPLIALLNKMTDKELKLWVKTMRNSGQMGGDEFATKLRDAGPVLARISKVLGEDVAQKIRDGMHKRGTTVYEEAKAQGILIDKGVDIKRARVVKVDANTDPASKAIDRFLKRYSGKSVQLQADIAKWARKNKLPGGGVAFEADGTEDHRAQISPAGAWRVWAEPETGGEAYIPLASAKRSRSEQILGNVADRFGYDLAPKMFANGGITMPVNVTATTKQARRAVDSAIKQAVKQISTFAVMPSGGGPGVERWRGVALSALRYTNSPPSWIGSLLRRMNQESGGNPRAINLWDINARRGIPSMGLMQTILPTFNAYAGRLRGRGVWDPLANIVASINYANARYGSAPRGWNRPGGYRYGTDYVPTDGMYRLHRGEQVVPPGHGSQPVPVQRTTNYHANVTASPHAREIARKVIEAQRRDEMLHMPRG